MYGMHASLDCAHVHTLSRLYTFTQAIIRAVCAVIDAFHFAVPVVGDRPEAEEEAIADGDAAYVGDDGASQTKRIGPGVANDFVLGYSNEWRAMAVPYAPVRPILS